MKQLTVLVFALFMGFGFAQDLDRERHHNERKERREKISPEKKSEIQSKRLTLTLDLSEKQQSQVKTTLLKHFQEGKKKMDVNKSKKDLSEEERHNALIERLDAQILLKNKMKEILNEHQYEKYSKMMNRRFQKGKHKKRGPARKK